MDNRSFERLGARFLDFIPDDAHAAARALLDASRRDGGREADLPLRARDGARR
jgi:hypothetical protein